MLQIFLVLTFVTEHAFRGVPHHTASTRELPAVELPVVHTPIAPRLAAFAVLRVVGPLTLVLACARFPNAVAVALAAINPMGGKIDNI